jgi:hypothetical protein
MVVPDPEGELHGGTPTWGWRRAPEHLVTRRQLRLRGLCPGGRPPVGQIIVGRYQMAWLYDVRQARPKRVPSPAQLAALGKALAARRWCASCERDVGYCISIRYGECADCLG